METIKILAENVAIEREDEEGLALYLIEAKVSSLRNVSDGYHTIEELYDHRITLFIALCKRLQCDLRPPRMGQRVWRSKTHHDGTSWDGWFIVGIDRDKGEQISYHLPLSRWEETSFADTLDRAPEWDGHTSADVLERLKNL